MKVLILCGGMGTRLKEETEYRPKPMVEIGDRPILWHIMRLYTYYGFKDFVLCLGFKGDMIKDYFLKFDARNSDFTIKIGQKKAITYHQPYDDEDVSITLANTGQETLTGSRVKLAAKYIDGDDDNFMLTYGDGLSNINIKELLKFHKSHGKLATISTIRPTTRFGVVDIGPDGLVNKFEEKPIDSSWSNAGFMVLNKRVLDYIPSIVDSMLEHEVFEKLARDGQLAAFRHEGFFFPMDTYRDYLALNKIWDSSRVPWAVWDRNLTS